MDKPDQVHAIVDSLQSSLSSVYEGHRIAVVALYSEVSRNVSKCFFCDVVIAIKWLSKVTIHLLIAFVKHA